MEHYYVINGNEFGLDLHTKKNFTILEDADKHFEKVKTDDFGCILMYVNSSGIEKEIKAYCVEDDF